MADIVVTWPKTRVLRSYLMQLEGARQRGEEINYHVHHPPDPTPERCYIVWDGAVRGYNDVIAVEYRPADRIRRVDGPGFWPAGFYVVRRPDWHSVTPLAMRGFRGWRWFDRSQVGVVDAGVREPRETA